MKALTVSDLLSSRLHDQNTFYAVFYRDLERANQQVVIESPFITTGRIGNVLPLLSKLRRKRVSITVNTRTPEEHIGDYELQAIDAIASLQAIGVQVLYTGKLHRKIAIIDNKLLWEGSLNILSQFDSCEIMRRTESSVLASEMTRFIDLDQYYQ